MQIINFRKGAAILAIAALLSLGYAGPRAWAGHTAIHISPAVAGTAVLAANGSSTVLGTFSPNLDLASSTNASLAKSATSSATAYYGVDVVSSTSSPDVHWRITVSHATESLTSGAVTIQEVGTYDSDSGQVRSSPATYNTTETSGDLVLNGNVSGWSVSSGAFTNVDQITFATTAPLGTYTVTRALINEVTGSAFDAPFSFTVNLMAASDTEAPAVPAILFPAGPHATTSNPITIGGLAEANSSIIVTGGASTSTASTTGSGTWSVSVNLNVSTTNTISVRAMDASGNVSGAANISVTHSSVSGPDVTAPSAPTITFPSSPHSTSTNPILIGGLAEANSTITISGGASTLIGSADSGGTWSATVSLTASSTNLISVTATDASGNTSATTTLSVTHSTSTATSTPPGGPGTSTPPTSTSSPIITLSGSATISVFACNGFTEPGFSATDASGTPITATSSLSISGTVGTQPGTYVLVYTATDASGNTASTTRTVILMPCSSGGGGGGGGGNGGLTGIARAAAVTPPATSIAGEAVGLNLFQTNLLPPGQVLGVSTDAALGVLLTQNLRFGSRGPQVAALQMRLRALGYFNGPITGFYGPLTRNAVRAFQRAHGVSATGTVGPLTRAVLNS